MNHRMKFLAKTDCLTPRWCSFMFKFKVPMEGKLYAGIDGLDQTTKILVVSGKR